MSGRNVTASCVLAITLLALAGCGGGEEFTEPVVLGGVEIPAAVLNRGRENYVVYCRACHGMNGDGNGPAAKGLRPPPRDFRSGIIKYASVSADYLPPDADFERIVRGGLHGTAMLKWEISDDRLHSVIQYIKTFSDRWQDEYEEVGESISPTPDPFVGREAEGVALGRELYHGLAKCYSCHPAYADRAFITRVTREMTGNEITTFRPNLYEPELKETDYGVKILPLDFTYHPIRAGTTAPDLFRTIAAGIGGTAMPTWHGSIPDDQIWAMAYYVRHLAGLRDTDEGRRLMAGLRGEVPAGPPGSRGR